MGNKYEVYVYTRENETQPYDYVQVHRGEWLLPALWALFQQKCKHGAGCAKLEMRG